MNKDQFETKIIKASYDEINAIIDNFDMNREPFEVESLGELSLSTTILIVTLLKEFMEE